MTTVLVTDAERGSAVAVIRSLGRAGYRVVAAASRRYAPGFHSRYTSESVRYPDPTRDATGAVDALIDAARRHAVDLVIPVTDEISLPLANQRHRLPAGCRVAVPDEAALEVVVDKLNTVDLAKSLGVPVPASVAVDSFDEARPAGQRLGWPVVVKPRQSYDWRPGRVPSRRWVAYARDEVELRAALESTDGGGVVLQRFHPGTARAVSLLTHEGAPLAAFQHRRIREVPLTGGASAFRQSEAVDPDLFRMSVKLLSDLKWTGVAMVEFKGGRCGSVLMEINGRIWGSLPLAVASGMDFPTRLADLLIGGPPPAGTPVDTDYEIGVRSRDLELELVWIGDVLRRRPASVVALPRRREAARVAARLLMPRDGYDVLDRGDIRPGLVEIAKLVSKPVRHQVRRLLGRNHR